MLYSIYKFLKITLCIAAGVTMYLWLAGGTYDETSLGGRAKILYVIINFVGWNGLFAIAGIITSTTSFGIFSLFDGDEYGIWDDLGEE